MLQYTVSLPLIHMVTFVYIYIYIYSFIYIYSYIPYLETFKRKYISIVIVYCFMGVGRCLAVSKGAVGAAVLGGAGVGAEGGG